MRIKISQEDPSFRAVVITFKVTMILQSLINIIKKSPRTAIFTSMLGIYYCVFWIAGTIPVNGGAGWDGAVFLKIIKAVSSGHWPNIDAYRETRIGGFLPITIGAMFFNLDDASIVKGQIIINALQLAISVTILFEILIKLGLDKKTATISVGSFVFSWPVLVMPIYYPILSDHTALFIVCISTWFWINSKNIALVAVSSFSTLVIPGLFLIPLTMASLHFEQKKHNLSSHTVSKIQKIIIPIMSILGVLLIFKIAYLESNVTEQQLLSSVGGPALASFKLKWVSLSISITMLSLSLWKLISISSMSEILNRIAFRPACLSILATAITHIGLYIYVQNHIGFKGPPLLDNMLYQSLILPAAQLVSHFLYFGPVFLLGLVSIFRIKNTYKNIAIPFYFIFLLFLPALSLGSESRQWLAVFPIIIVCFSLTTMPTSLRLIVLMGSVFICFPIFGLDYQIHLALHASEDLMSTSWQYYFGRQGPWMSQSSYLVGLSLAVLFLAVCFWCVKRNISSARC